MHSGSYCVWVIKMGKLIGFAANSKDPDTHPIFQHEPDPIPAYSNKWDKIGKIDEEERLRDLKALAEPSESHLLEILIVLGVATLVIIIIIKCFCEKSTPLQTWFNTKYRPGHIAANSRRSSQAVQNIDGIPGATTPVPVAANIFRPIKPHDANHVNDKSPLSGIPGDFGRKKSHNLSSDDDNPNPYGQTTVTTRA